MAEEKEQSLAESEILKKLNNNPPPDDEHVYHILEMGMEHVEE